MNVLFTVLVTFFAGNINGVKIVHLADFLSSEDY